MPFCHYPRCNVYCAAPEHAILVMARPETPYTAFVEFAASFGGQLRFVKPIPEIDAEAHGKTLSWSYTTGTGEYRRIRPQAEPGKIVWRLHINFRDVQAMPPEMAAVPATAAVPSLPPCRRGLWHWVRRWRR